MQTELNYLKSKLPKHKPLIYKYYNIEPNLLRFLSDHDQLSLLIPLDKISPYYTDITNRQTDPPAFYFDRIESSIKDYLQYNPESILINFIKILDADFKLNCSGISDNEILNN